MKTTPITVKRETKETNITVTLCREGTKQIHVQTGLPFFDHLLTSFAFHGGFDLSLEASGDLMVDPHHTVEDVGLVLGDGFHRLLETAGQVTRFGYSIIPMDDALCEVIVDVCERPYLVYQVDFPEPLAGSFSVRLLKEFFYAFCHRARINLHLMARYGENSHHMAESLFKAFGRALAQAYQPVGGSQEGMSTKGTL
ncbi:MAG: imidazoleglycerol-phosphate dehydratase HisB [Spirochaetes bacterium]|nr:imidazoleglycerol-phosphate dehydratase HisB [Spirochaetota bacterium]